MNRSEFARRVQAELVERLGAEYSVTLKEVVKNNGIILQGVLIYEKNRNVTPTIYLEHYEEEYRKGKPLAEIADHILKVYKRYVPEISIDMNFFMDFQRVKTGIAYKLIHASENAALLEEIPHICFLDLAVCFYYTFYEEQIGEGTILIRNSHMEYWNTDTRELLQLAQQNTRELYGVELINMQEMLEDMPERKEVGEIKEALPEQELAQLFILSNKKKRFGAVAMILPGVLDETAKKLGSNLYLLPSSVHEMILLVDDGMVSPAYLQCVVREVNSTQVLPEEVLSDRVYYYDRDRKTVEMLEIDSLW